MTGTPPEPVTQFCVTIGAESAGPSGDANLALLQFRALAAGDTQIALERVIATMPDARDLPVVIERVTVVVAP